MPKASFMIIDLDVTVPNTVVLRYRVACRVPTVNTVMTTVKRLVEALAAGDPPAVQAVLHEDVKLRALLPSRYVEVAGPPGVAMLMLGWFANVPDIVPEATTIELVGDVWHVGYRFTGPRIVMEQHAYCTVADDKITRIRLVCSGTRPDGASTLDALGDGCATLTPKIAAELKTLAPGEVLGVLTDDPSAAEGIAAWSRLTGHALIATAGEPAGIRYYLRRRAS
jgi:TusA-related sulfurtransferase